MAAASTSLACRRGGRAGRLAGLALVLACAPPVHADETAAAWMKVDADRRTVRLQLVGPADGTNGTMNFNGYAWGEMQVIVPFGWPVHVDFESDALEALPHSIVIV